MSKRDDLLRLTADNVDDSMGIGRAPQPATPTPSVHGVPARFQGVKKSTNTAEIPTERIAPDPDQPREEYDPEALQRLAESLKTRGQLQPIRVRWDEGRGVYMILVGERRWRAATMAGLAMVSAIVVDGPMDPAEQLAVQLVENCLREDLKPIEQAKALKTLMDRNHWSVRQVADELAMVHVNVVRALALLKLPESIQAQVEAGDLPPATAYEISKVADSAEREALAARVKAEGMTRDEAVEAIKSAPSSKSGGKGRGVAKGKVRKVTAQLFRAGGGKITVENRRGLDDALTLAMLEEAAGQVKARLRTEDQEAA
jgi:ParB family transcriptional regulator, chromosome partitioning protein